MRKASKVLSRFAKRNQRAAAQRSYSGHSAPKEQRASVATGVSGTQKQYVAPPSTKAERQKAIDYLTQKGTKIVDLRFTDLHGTWQHIQIPISQFTASAFDNGYGFDGSSIRGWQPIHASDMLLLPISQTHNYDPFTRHPTATFLCSVVDPETKVPYSRDPRFVSLKAMEHLRDTGIASIVNIGAEVEFFIFDHMSYHVGAEGASYSLDSNESHWNSHKNHSGHYKIRQKEGYFPVKPWDQLQDLRSEIVHNLEGQGLEVEASHHEVAAPGQCEIDFKFADLVTTGDNVQLFKYVARNTAANEGKTVTFMPKPIASDNGSGMHTHVSLHRADGSNMFTGDSYAGLSELGLYFVGGLMAHAKSLCAFTNPTINSYKRLVPGFEAPINFAYSGRNRSAAIRIPISHPKARRLEFRTPDPSCNPYLNFSAVLMAGLDGIERKLHPGNSLDQDIYSLSSKELENIPKAPGSLEEALDALEKDNAYLTRGNVFSPDLIDTWLERKREEVDVWRKQPTPWEFKMYYDC